MFKAKILSNLEQHPAKWVNPFVALNGLIYKEYVEGDKTPHTELDELVYDGVITKKIVQLGLDKFKRPIYGDMYRAVASANKRKFTIVK